MTEPVQRVTKAVDSIQQRLTDYAFGLTYDGLSPDAIHGAKVRVIDTLGALIGGFFSEPCRIARNLAALMPDPAGATVIGTRMKTMPDMAAFANGAAAAYPAMTDSYHRPGSDQGHASETVAPLIAAGGRARAARRARLYHQYCAGL